MDSTPQQILPEVADPVRPGPHRVRQSGRRRRPSGEAPPLPHHLQTSGVGWLVALVVLVVLSIAVFDGGLRGPAVTVMVLDDRGSERFFAFAMLACDRLCYNRLPCATTARLP